MSRPNDDNTNNIPESDSTMSSSRNDTPAMTTTNTTNAPTLRHAGRAHVRGKIRRIWRPRYLEVWDTGLVRYYELPVSASLEAQQQNRWLLLNDNEHGETLDDLHHVNMIPKYTLRIYHARILDVTTLRDMHCGLPQGTYGFVFRGQRLSLPQSSHQPFLPKKESLLYQIPSPSSANTTNTMSTVKKSTLSSLTTGMQSCSGSAPNAQTPPLEDPRDFLCAVNTLEDAQSWVVALQWAAQQNPTRLLQHVLYQNVTDMEEEENDDDNDEYDPQSSWTIPQESQWQSATTAATAHDEDASYEAVQLVKESPATSPQRPSTVTTKELTTNDTSTTKEPQPSTTVKESTTTSQRKLPSTPTKVPAVSRTMTPPSSPLTTGKVVVSRVVQYRIVRVLGFSFEVAYEIHSLLLRKHSSQQWSMLRTANDFQHLIGNLCKELGPSLLDRAQLGPIRRLPRLKDQPSEEQLVRSLSIVDSILRSLVMDASIVNTAAMKVFLGISVPSQQSGISSPERFLSLRWIQTHNPQSVLHRTTHVLSDTVVLDHYVKAWLKEKRPKKPTSAVSDTCALYVLQRPLLCLGAAGVSMATIVPAIQYWQSMVPRVTLRVDYLLVSWITAAYCGRKYQTLALSSTSLNPPRQRATPTPKPALPTKAGSNLSEKSYSDEAEEERETDDNLVAAALLTEEEDLDEESDGEDMLSVAEEESHEERLSSPLPRYPGEHNSGQSCWSIPVDDIFHVRGENYLVDRVKVPSGPSPLTCRGVDIWITDNPPRHIARHPSVLGGKLRDSDTDTFLVNFLLPFGNFVSYFSVPPLDQFPEKIRRVWTNFLEGDQQYRDARLKLLPVVVEGPWIVKTAVGPGKSPALLGKVIPLQYFLQRRDGKGIFEVDVIITASTIAKGILSVVKGHTRSISIAFAFIIEAAEQEDLPETVLCSFQIHHMVLEDCPLLPECNLDEIEA